MFHGWITAAVLILSTSHSARGFAQESPATLEKLDEVIRVKLGEYAAFQVNGYDLKLNGRARIADNRKIEVQCTRGANRDEISLGNLGKFSSPLTLEASGGFIFVNGDPFRSRLIIHEREGKCLVVNELGVEKYVSGVINNEMQANWPLEALKAQAIAARSYAIGQIHETNQPYYHVDSSTKDQMYRGAGSETIKSNLATSSTRGTVLYYDSNVLKAYYHADCGGKTDLPESVWGQKENGPYKSVYCPYHIGAQVRKRWEMKIEKHQLEAALRRVSGALPNGFLQLASLSNGELTPGNRHKSIVLTDTGGRHVEIPANTFRQYLGYTRLKSTKFEVRAEANMIDFRGVGSGHGVGMCQLGAREMALQGKNHLAILKHYYPLATVANLY